MDGLRFMVSVLLSQGSEEHELQIDIGMIVFHHHPLMSREHVVAARIGEYYEAYIKHRQKNYAVFYHEKLRTLRLALNTMKKYTPASLDTEGKLSLRIKYTMRPIIKPY